MKNCNECNNTSKSYNPPSNESCGTCGSRGLVDASCVRYTGPDLACIDEETGSKLEDIILKIEAKVCENQGDYSGYNTACLSEQEYIETQEQFVEIISAFVCQLRADLDSMGGNTNSIEELEEAVDGILNPQLDLCEFSEVIPSDTYRQVIVKFSEAICSLAERTDLDGILWDKCTNTSTSITNNQEAFNYIVDRLCEIESELSPLPTFNNVGTCLPGTLTTTDTLVSTIEKLKIKVCEGVSYNPLLTPKNCLQTSDNSFQTAFDLVYTTVDYLYQNRYYFDEDDFDIELNDIGDECSGVKVSLNTALRPIDRMVSVNENDTPGFLNTKIQEGDNIQLEISSSGESIVISSTYKDELVKASTLDSTPGFLDTKIIGGDGIEVMTSPLGGELIIRVEDGFQGEDELVKINSSDITSGYLSDKLVAGTGISISPSVNNDTLVVNSTLVNDNDRVSIDGTDVPGFLEDKLQEGQGITLTKVGQNLVITASTLDEKVKVNQAGTSGYLNDKIQTINTLPTLGIRVNKTVSNNELLNLDITTDFTTITENVVTTLESNPTLVNRLCDALPCTGGTVDIDCQTMSDIFINNIPDTARLYGYHEGVGCGTIEICDLADSIADCLDLTPVNLIAGDNIVITGDYPNLTITGTGGGGGTPVPTNLAIGTRTATYVPITNSNGTGLEIPEATTSLAGLLTSTDKAKIDNLATVAGSGDYNDLLNQPTIPAQVSLNEGANISITGTYPNLTISSSGGSTPTPPWDMTTLFVDGTNDPGGDGSVTNPFQTLEDAIDWVIGMGDRSSPTRQNAQIIVRKANYLTTANLYVEGLDIHFEDNARVTYFGTSYLVDMSESGVTNSTGFSISGKMNFHINQGGLLRHVSKEVNKPLNIELNNIESQTDETLITIGEGIEAGFNLVNIKIHGEVKVTSTFINSEGYGHFNLSSGSSQATIIHNDPSSNPLISIKANSSGIYKIENLKFNSQISGANCIVEVEDVREFVFKNNNIVNTAPQRGYDKIINFTGYAIGSVIYIYNNIFGQYSLVSGNTDIVTYTTNTPEIESNSNFFFENYDYQSGITLNNKTTLR